MPPGRRSRRSSWTSPLLGRLVAPDGTVWTVPNIPPGGNMTSSRPVPRNFPILGLSISTERLTLRFPTLPELDELADLGPHPAV
jgi:hypothetical protein